MARSAMLSLLLVLQLCSILAPGLRPLLSSTSAAPVQVPNLTQCYLASDSSVDGPPITLPQNCCLPVQTAVRFSLASYTPQTHVRRRAQSASADVIAQYVRAYELMKALPEDDPRSFVTQANVHCAFCNGAYRQPGFDDVEVQVHFSWLFLVWHRWFLYFHERILAKLVGDPSFSLVFWNWDDQQDGGNVFPAMFARNNTALYDDRRRPAHQPPVVVDLIATDTATDNATLVSQNLNAMYKAVVTATTAQLFMGGAARAGTNLRNSTVKNATLGGAIENGIHNAIHFWTGNPNLALFADMGTFLNASRDPVFYAHHSNIDRLWTLWHTLPGEDRQDHNDFDFLNAEFYFYDENAQLVVVTVRDALNNSNLGISYEVGASDDLWINYQPPVSSNGSAVAETLSHGVPLIEESPKNGTVALGERLVALVACPTGAKPKHATEVLTIQGVKIPPNRTTFLTMLVFVNLPNANTKTPLNSAEYVGTFNVLPSGKRIKTNVELEIGDNLKRIGIDKEDTVVITLVIKGLKTLTIQGMKIRYEPDHWKGFFIPKYVNCFILIDVYQAFLKRLESWLFKIFT